MKRSEITSYAQAFLHSYPKHEEEMVSLFEKFVVLVKKEEKIFAFLASPAIDKEEKKHLLSLISEKEGITPINAYLFLLNKHDAFPYLEEISEALHLALNDFKGVEEGIVYSHLPLEEQEIKSIEKKIEKELKAEVHLENKIDKTLLGGFRVFVAGKLFDASINGRLARLKEHLLKE